MLQTFYRTSLLHQSLSTTALFDRQGGGGGHHGQGQVKVRFADSENIQSFSAGGSLNSSPRKLHQFPQLLLVGRLLECCLNYFSYLHNPNVSVPTCLLFFFLCVTPSLFHVLRKYLGLVIEYHQTSRLGFVVNVFLVCRTPTIHYCRQVSVPTFFAWFFIMSHNPISM